MTRPAPARPPRGVIRRGFGVLAVAVREEPGIFTVSALGSALFVLIPLQAGMEIADLSRVLQGVTAGIGFLCAGAILKPNNSDDIKGLTTAASVWLTAAIGIAAGMGREGTAVLSAVFALVILSILRSTTKDKPNRPEDDR